MFLIRDIIIILTFCTLISLLIIYLKKEGFTNYDKSNIQFMTKQQTNAFLYNDPDGYIANLSPTDLYARNTNSTNNYRLSVATSALDFSDELKNKLLIASNKADELLKTLTLGSINCSNIVSLPWIFALTKGKSYESGLPHTRSNIIFLSTIIDSNKLVNTLIHEKIHIYQRAYPEEISNYLESKGYTKYKSSIGIPRVRANPDLDGWIYYNPINKKPMIAFYSSDKPSSISDIVLTDPSFEHPYELMAYTIAEKLSSGDDNC
jgi:hypothetical protein